MILRELVEHAKAAQGASGGGIPDKCRNQRIAGYLLLSSEGKYLDLQRVEKGISVWGPFISPTQSGKPGLGIHQLQYLMGPDKVQNRSDQQVKEKADLTRSFVQKCTEHVDVAPLKAFHRFLVALETDEATRGGLAKDLADPAKSIRASGYVAVLVNDELWFRAQKVTDFWARTGYHMSDEWPERQSKATRASAEGARARTTRPVRGQAKTGRCLVCGADGRLARLMDNGLNGFGKDKPKLVSFNRAAYRSRGLGQTFNSPICERCIDLAPGAWNSLVANDSSTVRVGDFRSVYHRYVFWGEIPLEPWKRHDPRAWRDLMRSARGRSPTRVAPRYFHLLGLGSHRSTAYVVAWLKKDQDSIAEAVIRWGRWQNILGDKQKWYYSTGDFVRSLRPRRRRADRDYSTLELNLERDLFLVSLGAGGLPDQVLARLVSRLATEPEDVFGAADRLALLNICLYARYGKEEVSLDELSEQNRNAFNAGRVFNLIVYAQRQAIGEPGKTILAGNAALASSRPKAILGRLISRFHSIYLPKLRRDNPRTAGWIDRQIGELVRDTVFPDRNRPEQMGWFWKGFYYRDIESIKNSEEAKE